MNTRVWVPRVTIHDISLNMGHRITQFTGHMIEMETDRQGNTPRHPEPGLFYGSLPNYPHPNFQSLVPSQGNQCNFNFHHMPEHHGSALFYGMPQLNIAQHQHPIPAPHLDLAVGPPSGHYSPYLPALSGVRDFPVQINHGTHDQLSLSSTQRAVGIPTDAYSIRASFKRKNTEGASGSHPHHSASAGPSSSITFATALTADSDVTMLDTGSFLPPEYGCNDPTLMVDGGSQRSTRNMPRMIGHEPIPVHNNRHLIQGNFTAPPPVQLHRNPWLDMHYGSNNGDVGTFVWAHAPLHYPHVTEIPASVNGASNGSPSDFLHLPLPQGHARNPPPPMQGVGGYNVNLPSQVAASTHQMPGISSSNFQDVPPMNFRSYRAHRREIMLDSSSRHYALPHMRVLPEDEVAILEFPRYHEAGDIDQHRDMRLDIDHMSYEELLALGEQIGSVGTGLSEEFIHNNLKIRAFTSSAACFNLEATGLDQQINFCVICQMDYEDGEEIAAVDCGHEYHTQCVKKWLLRKNTCPVCKATALGRKYKDL